MKLLALVPALFGLFLIGLSVHCARIEYIFAKKETVLTHARLISAEGSDGTYRYQAGEQTFTFVVRKIHGGKLPRTYPVRYLVEDPRRHEAYVRPWSGTPGHTRFNWFKYFVVALLGIFFLFAAVNIAMI